MESNKKTRTLVKGVVAIVLLIGVAVAAYLFFNTSGGNVALGDVNADEWGDQNDRVEGVVVARLTKAELEESINGTIDGSVPEDIAAKFSTNIQRIVVKNDPNVNIAVGFSELWVLKFLEIYSKITVIEEECVFDSNNRLETLVILVE